MGKLFSLKISVILFLFIINSSSLLLKSHLHLQSNNGNILNYQNHKQQHQKITQLPHENQQKKFIPFAQMRGQLPIFRHVKQINKTKVQDFQKSQISQFFGINQPSNLSENHTVKLFEQITEFQPNKISNFIDQHQ